MNAVGWFEVYVDDMERAKKFYEAVFERKLEKLASPDPEKMPLEMWSFAGHMESYGATGSLVKVEGMPAGNNSTIVYFGCEDCAIEEKRASENGGKVVQPKMSIGEHGFCSLVTDSEGNMIGLHSMK